MLRAGLARWPASPHPLPDCRLTEKPQTPRKSASAAETVPGAARLPTAVAPVREAARLARAVASGRTTRGEAERLVTLVAKAAHRTSTTWPARQRYRPGWNTPVAISLMNAAGNPAVVSTAGKIRAPHVERHTKPHSTTRPWIRREAGPARRTPNSFRPQPPPRAAEPQPGSNPARGTPCFRQPPYESGPSWACSAVTPQPSTRRPEPSTAPAGRLAGRRAGVPVMRWPPPSSAPP